ncbi:MAG: helix-turn-helix transcriptional regulator [Verrucomicrobia bacterium]|nr:helix-turn-helix transcriptional regulator [Verrucomicrobiota bacterium]
MSGAKPLSSRSPANASRWEDLIFQTLGNPKRCRLLYALARNASQSASKLRVGVGLSLDATLKHLVAMRSAGLLIVKQDPTDARRRFYSLVPAIQPVTTATGHMIDFGFLVVRF